MLNDEESLFLSFDEERLGDSELERSSWTKTSCYL